MQGSPERSRRAPMFDSLSFDPFAFLDDGLSPAEVGISGCDVVEALVIVLMVLCPNYHRQIRYGKVEIADDTE